MRLGMGPKSLNLRHHRSRSRLRVSHPSPDALKPIEAPTHTRSTPDPDAVRPVHTLETVLP